MEHTDPQEWLSLGQAADLLGVHPATIRRWADKGRLPHIRTPGGHRRFSRAEMEAYLSRQRGTASADSLQRLAQGTIGHARQQLGQRDAQAQPWRFVIDDTTRRRKQESGHRMVELALQYAEGHGERDAALEQGLALSLEYGQDAARQGLSLADASRAFLFFRASLVEITFQQEFLDQKFTDRDLERYQRMERFFDESLLAMIEAHEAIG